LFENVDNEDGTLNYDKVWNNIKKAMENVARVYAKSMYIIHYMHDKYYYEKAQMAFMDSHYGVDIAYGIA
jgi:formate C-acetyltransferase